MKTTYFVGEVFCTSGFSWGRATGGWEPEGVTEPQENPWGTGTSTQAQEYPEVQKPPSNFKRNPPQVQEPPSM
jgi:hypothetical protein